MNKILNRNIFLLSFYIGLFALLSACGGSNSGGGREDTSAGTVTLTSLNSGEEVIGTTSITWDNDEPNRSYVDIELSSDSGTTFTTIENRVADTGSYSWDTNTAKDCRNCRVRITGTDVVGNVTEPVVSSQDFIINNVPQVIGSATYFHDANNAYGNTASNSNFYCKDTVVIPFDKPITTRSLLSRDLQLTVPGDSYGEGARVVLGPKTNELSILMGAELCDATQRTGHLHVGGKYNINKGNYTAPSGINIPSNLPFGTIVSRDTNRDADSLLGGIDIEPSFQNRTFDVIDDSANTVAVAVGNLNIPNSKIDLVRINTNGEAPIFRNSTGSFINNNNVLLLGDTNNTSVVLGDVDGTNGLDIIVGNTNANLIYLNNGSGSFTTLNSSVGSSTTQAVALGDIDGNGTLDLVTANNGANRIWRNGGSANFTEDATPQTLGTNNSQSIVLVDVDGDSDLDIIVGNDDGQANKIYTNDGSGLFIDSNQNLGSSKTRSIAYGDIDNDGDIDFITGNHDGQANLVWVNNGSGIFTNTNQSLGDSNTTSVILVDIGQDGDLDLVVGNNTNQPNKVYINNAKGVFTDSGQLLENYETEAIAVGDFDDDGDIDVISGNNVSQRDNIWSNSSKFPGQSIFVDSKQQLGTNSSHVALADVDNDNDLDLVIAKFGEANEIWLNDNNTGEFLDSKQYLGNYSTYDMAIGDIDNDGDLDIVTANANEANRVWVNNHASNPGVGVYTDSGQTLGNYFTLSIALADIDGDDDLDIVTGNFGDNRVWRNDGSGNFSQETIPQTLGGGSVTYSIDLGDVDGDGDIDLVTGNALSGSADPVLDSNKVWLNGGDASGSNTGVFTDSGQDILEFHDTGAVKLKDMDKDGDLDIVVGNSTNNHVVINNGNNTGIFDTTASLGTESLHTTSLAIADINGDGLLDVFSGNFYGGEDNKLWLSRNNGAIGFDDSGETLGISTIQNNDTRSIAVGDIDGDGDLDIVIGHESAQGNTEVWANDTKP